MPNRQHNIKLSKRTVDALPFTGREYIRFDTDLPRFGVRVQPDRLKSYLIQYRAGGRTRRVRLGLHGAVTCDEARRKAQELLGLVARGENPAEEIRTQRRTPTVAALCDRFLTEHVAHSCEPSTRKEYRRSVELFIKPKLGNFKLPDVKWPDILELYNDLRGRIPYQANRTYGVLSSMFSFAEDRGLISPGSRPFPKRFKGKFKEDPRKRYLNAEEYRRLWSALAQFEAERPGMRPAVDAIRLLALTGCRLSEIQKLRWEHVQGSKLELPFGKTGGRTVYLSPDALAALNAIPRLPENPFVITGRLPGQHLTDLQRPWRRIRARAGLEDVHIHDLRHSFASAAVANGESLPMIGKLLGHRQVQTTARYAHLADDPVHAAAARVGGALQGYLAEPPDRASPQTG